MTKHGPLLCCSWTGTTASSVHGQAGRQTGGQAGRQAQDLHTFCRNTFSVSGIPAESTVLTVTVTMPVGLDARATVMKIGFLQDRKD